MSIIKEIEEAQLKKVPHFNPGDTVDVHVRIVEGEKERIQIFSGTCIRRNGGGMNETFTVRRIVDGEGVERIFPLHSPRIAKMKVTRRGKTRRAKLYYLRQRTGKGTRVKEIQGKIANLSDEKIAEKPGKKG
ncbi:MAG: 50S ribosomal protein L19 [Planctomycetes bacterium]|nr:50S ribosomal protein L19 [Planctomycetota bacterium]